MAWPNPFRKHDQNTRTCWQYTFQLTPDHLTLEQSQPLKHSYDQLGEDCLDILNELCPPSSGNTPQQSNSKDEVLAKPSPDRPVKPKRDLFLLLRDNHLKDEKLRQFWDELHDVPDWVDWDQIARGQDVFYRYGGATLTGLAFQSLLGGMGANRVVEVLARTGGFGVNVARHRLFETTQHILECTRSLESVKPGGAGFASSIRVRLLHAAVRQRIMKLAKSRPEYYDVSKYGVPINDLDCVATIATFSSTIIWLSLPRQGIWIRQQEIVDYIALWRLIAFYTGTPTDFFETPAKAKACMESLLLNEVDPSDTSRLLAANIIRALENTPPTFASRSFLEANARWLNGNDLADALGLGRPSLYHWALMGGQCLFFMFICYLYRSIPSWDKRKVAALRKIFWLVIVEGKYGLGEETVFDFKYVPDYNVTTVRGDDSETKSKESGIERRNLTTLLIAVGCTGVVAYCGLRIAAGMLRRIF